MSDYPSNYILPENDGQSENNENYEQDYPQPSGGTLTCLRRAWHKLDVLPRPCLLPNLP